MPPAKHTQRIDEAGGPEEQAVARGFDDAAALLIDFKIGALAAKRPQPAERLLLVASR